MYFNKGTDKGAEEEGMLILTAGNHGKSQGEKALGQSHQEFQRERGHVQRHGEAQEHGVYTEL